LDDRTLDDPNGWFQRRRSRKHARDGFGTYLHLSDAALAFALAIEQGWEGFEAYHFVADDVVTEGPVAEMMAELSPATPLPENWPETRSPVVTSKAQRHFDWQPQVSLLQRYQERAAGRSKAM
jgi:nucleoside-diphosphate-sugar epimerase